MAKSKYKDIILEGRWKWKCYTETKMNTFENIYNGMLVELTHRQVESILNGKDTLGHIITRRLKNSESFVYGNSVQKGWKKIKYNHRKK